MEISTIGHANINAATKRQTEIVFPKRRGVEMLCRRGEFENKISVALHSHHKRINRESQHTGSLDWCSATYSFRAAADKNVQKIQGDRFWRAPVRPNSKRIPAPRMLYYVYWESEYRTTRGMVAKMQTIILKFSSNCHKRTCRLCFRENTVFFLRKHTHMKDPLMIRTFPTTPVECCECFSQAVYARKPVDVCRVGTGDSWIKARNRAKFFLEEITSCLSHATVGFVIFIMLHSRTWICDILGKEHVIVAYVHGCHCQLQKPCPVHIAIVYINESNQETI